MTAPQLSPERREQADKVFKRSWRLGIFLWWGFVLLLSFAERYVLTRVFHFAPLPPWEMFMGWSANSFAQPFALRQVRQAGLSQEREERQFIPRTTEFKGEPVEIRARNLISGGHYLLLWFSLSLISSGAMYIGGLRFSTLGWGLLLWPLVATFFPSLALACLRHALVLRLDQNGVFSEAVGLWGRRVAWNQIAGVEVVSMFNYLGNPMLPYLAFKDGNGKTVLKLSLFQLLIGKGRTDQERRDAFLAQMEAKFNGN